MHKTFNFIIILFSYILCFLSLVAFIFIHINLAKYEFQFNLDGINNYFKALTEYKELFAGTITLIVAYYGIQRFDAADDANRDRIKLDRFSDWKNITEMRMADIKENNKNFLREFSRVRFNFYSDLYDNSMAINNKSELLTIFNKYFKKTAPYLEKTTKKFLEMEGIYPNQNFTYFYDDFFYVFIDCLDNSYETIYIDLKELYVKALDPDRVIDDKLYKDVLNRNAPIS